jgi:acyl transferase domain-containing protein/acyl carrier protein
VSIAIIGMAARIGGAPSLESFWDGLCRGHEYVRTVPDERLLAAGVPAADLDDPGYVKRRAFLDDPAMFAAPFFGYTPREAEAIDPQHRLFLECAHEAVEDAGYDPRRYDGLIGVFATASTNRYRWFVDRDADPTGVIQADIGCEVDFLATRVSYKLDLRGPSMVVQTACSSSLVAVHMAGQSLLRHECDIAVVGGVAVQVPRAGYRYREGSIASPDGHCRAYDAGAAGTVGGDGTAVVVLKRLADAQADGDHVYAVVKGSAVNNDGATKVGFTAPSRQGQLEAIVEAQAVAGVEPRTIGYVEGHGTGTVIGDPIEVDALRRAFREGTDEVGFCALGSVKSNVGHLDVAAGMAGLVKATLSLYHRRIPPTLHFTAPNPACELDASPFYVNAELVDWPSPAGHPRRAGVSSFGIGGTNAHLVLEEMPPPSSPPGDTTASRPEQLLVLSAKTATALESATTELVAHRSAHPEQELADVAYTLQVGRGQFEYRRALLHGDGVETLTGRTRPDDRPVLFLFPGQGAQYERMGGGLYEHEPVFRDWVDRCCAVLVPELGLDLRTLLYPPDPVTGTGDRLRPTWLAQPALFVTSYALAKTLLRYGIGPQAMLGHSIGEYVAACLAGVFTLEDALRLVATRGRLMQESPPGAMLGVKLPVEELELPAGVDLAAVNSPRQCVVSGPPAAIEELRDRLDRDGVASRALDTSHAFHSATQDGVVDRLVAAVQAVPRRPPALPYLSNVTGDWVTAGQATDPEYWGRQLRRPVRFSAGLRRALRDGAWALVEVGPGTGLGTLVRQHDEAADQTVVAAMRHPVDRRSDRAALLRALARLWLDGLPVDWAASARGEGYRRVSLPTYPFERYRYWAGEIAGGPARPDGLEPFAAPDGPIEERIAAAWRDVFGIGEVGRTDDFFELGGGSLVATQVLARLSDAFGLDVPLALVFERTTVASLAAGIEELLLDKIETLPEEATP